MCKHSDKLACNEIGQIRHCNYCKQVEVQIGSLVSYMSVIRFTNLYQSLTEIKKTIAIYKDTDFNEKLMITSPIKDTYFAFTPKEVKQLLSIMEEAIFMFEVRKILS